MTSRTILFRPGDEDNHTDGLGSKPYIGGETNTKRVFDTQKYSSKAEDEGESQYAREVRVEIQLPICKLKCKFHTHIESAIDMKLVEYVFCRYICS